MELKGNVEDYWEPVKNDFKNIYRKYVSPNIFFFVVMIILILALSFRYYSVNKRKKDNPDANIDEISNSFISKRQLTKLLSESYRQEKNKIQDDKIESDLASDVEEWVETQRMSQAQY